MGGPMNQPPPQDPYGGGGFGQQQQQGFGGPPPGGQPGGQFGALGPAAGGMMASAMGGGGPGPQKRNPIMTLLIPWGIMVVSSIAFSTIAGITGVYALAYLGQLGQIAGLVISGMFLNKMLGELKSVTGDTEITPIMMWIPGLNNIMAFLKVHPLMERARQQRGLQPAKPNWMYLIVPLFAFSSDLNDLA
jgi:hypothetical protein